MSTTPDANGGTDGRPSNVLVLAPSVGGHEDTVCEELLHATGSPRTHALIVTCLDSPADRLATWTDRGADPARTTVVDVDTTTRSAAATAGTASTTGRDVPNVTVESLPDVADLVELGETVDRYLDDAEWTTSLCLHSVTDLLGANDRASVFKFLEVLTSSVDRAGAVGHYHLNPDVHDPETVATIEVLFDTVVDLRDDTGGC